MHAKMQTEAERTIYNRRMHIGETPFAIIKNILEVRRFLLARAGEGAHGVALGVYGLQPEETDGGDSGTAPREKKWR